MRVRARAVFAESLRNAHRWLDDLVKDPNQTIELIAAREHKNERSIRMTLSLAFVAPPIVAAAIEGRLPRGFGSKRLMDLPMVWSHQWTSLGLRFQLRSDPQLSGRDHRLTKIAISERRLDVSRRLSKESIGQFWKWNFASSRLLKKSPRLRDRVIGGGFFHSWLGCAADSLGCGH
jgi:hypothetical protein